MAAVRDHGTMGLVMKLSIVAAAAAALVGTGAHAQAGAGPAPGTGDSSRAVSNSREENASYNRLIASQRPIRKGRAVAASAADITAGSQLRDIKGVPVGVVEKLDGEEAIVATAAGRVRIPIMGFGKDKAGLMLAMTAAELDAAVKAANGG